MTDRIRTLNSGRLGSEHLSGWLNPSVQILRPEVTSADRRPAADTHRSGRAAVASALLWRPPAAVPSPSLLAAVPRCRCVAVPLCRCAAVSCDAVSCVAVSLCRCAAVTLCRCAAVSLWRCVAVPLWRRVTRVSRDRPCTTSQPCRLRLPAPTGRRRRTSAVLYCCTAPRRLYPLRRLYPSPHRPFPSPTPAAPPPPWRLWQRIYNWPSADTFEHG